MKGWGWLNWPQMDERHGSWSLEDEDHQGPSHRARRAPNAEEEELFIAVQVYGGRRQAEKLARNSGLAVERPVEGLEHYGYYILKPDPSTHLTRMKRDERSDSESPNKMPPELRWWSAQWRRRRTKRTYVYITRSIEAKLFTHRLL